MSLVPSLLQAIVTTEGEALVLHVGEKPYVVTPTGQVDLATRGLTFAAVNGIVNELLPVESQRALDEFGAAQFELPPIVEFPGECFTVVAARGGDDLWAEIRRKSVPDEDRVPLELFGSSSEEPAAESEIENAPVDVGVPDASQLWPVADAIAQKAPAPKPPEPTPAVAAPPTPPGKETPSLPLIPPPPRDAPAEAVASVASKLRPVPPSSIAPAPPLSTVSASVPAPAPVVPRAPAVPAPVAPTPVSAAPETPTPVAPAPVAPAPVAPAPAAPAPVAAAPAAPMPVVSAPVISAPVAPVPLVAEVPAAPPVPIAPPAPIATPVAVALPAPALVSPPVAPVLTVPPPVAAAPTPPAIPIAPVAAQPSPVPLAAPATPVLPVAPVVQAQTNVPRPAVVQPPPIAQPAVVLPLARSPIRPESPPRIVSDALAGLDTLLRIAVARGASTLYLSSDSRPSVRVDGDIYTIEGAPVLGPNDVEALVLTLMPERNAEALRSGVTSEWICDVQDVGRVRCMSFRDHRGPGGVFRLMPSRATTAEQLGLSREIQALAFEPDGLLLVAGPRSSGKRTLITGLVDLVNRMRRDHVITVEREITSAHDRIGSFVSQREVRGGTEEMLAVARAALREDPDVLVLEEVRTPGLMNLALDAAASGQLVIGGFPAPNAPGAIDRIIDLYPADERRQVQLSLAQNLRGVVAQVLLRKTTGGRVAAREVLLNTPAVRSVLAEGKTSQLPLAIEGGRPFGMSPLNDSLVGYVQNGLVDVREAYHRAADRTGFLAMLKRHGLDTSLIERLA